MLNIYIKYILLFHFIIFANALQAKPIDISVGSKVSLLENSSVCIVDNSLSIENIIETNLLKPYSSPYINIGMQDKTIWIKIELDNNSNNSITKVLVISSTLLDHIALYKSEELDMPSMRGVENLSGKHHTLFPYYTISLKPNSKQIL